MDFKEYQEKAVTTKLYNEKYKVIYPTIGLAGESGEVSEKIKKWIRDEGEEKMSEERKIEVKKELGDVLWYINAIATDLGMDLEDVAMTNIEKLFSRKDRNILHGDGDNR